MVGLLLMYGRGGVVCVYLFRSFSDIMMCGCRYTLSSGTYVCYLVRLTDFGGCGWK